MSVNKIFYLLVSFIFKPVFLLCQVNSLTVSAGVATYDGDLSSNAVPSSIYVTGQYYGIKYSHGLTNRLSANVGFNFAYILGYDKYNTRQKYLARNLSFETYLQELTFTTEFSLTDPGASFFSPYILAGGAIFHFNPFAYAKTEKIFLRPLNTEGQGFSKYPEKKPYSLFQPALLAGVGFRFRVSDKISTSFEMSARKLFTDYLDDVSTNYIDRNDLYLARGALAVGMAFRADEIENNPVSYPAKGTQRGDDSANDSYYFAGLSFTYKLGGFYNTRINRKRYLKCPVF